MKEKANFVSDGSGRFECNSSSLPASSHYVGFNFRTTNRGLVEVFMYTYLCVEP